MSKTNTSGLVAAGFQEMAGSRRPWIGQGRCGNEHQSGRLGQRGNWWPNPAPSRREVRHSGNTWPNQ